MIKDELRHLKECQVNFVIYAATLTGLLLGLIFKIGSENSYSMLSLSPLIIIIPYWWIYFDKATTVTRASAYCRIIEEFVLKKKKRNLSGFETDLAKYRKVKDDAGHGLRYPKYSEIKQMLKHKTIYRYWIYSYLTFFGLSLLCLILSISHSQKGGSIYLYAIAIPALFYTMIYNFKVIWHLNYGEYSHKKNYKLWTEILSPKNEKEIAINPNRKTKNKTKYLCLIFLVVGFTLGIFTGTYMIKNEVPEDNINCNLGYLGSECIPYNESEEGLESMRFVDFQNIGTQPITEFTIYENHRRIRIKRTIMPGQNHTYNTDSCDVYVTRVEWCCGECHNKEIDEIIKNTHTPNK